ncbi:hypothetical protein CIHG_08352 [Coccidioides immitis H538.4]|uniref:Uncharacterized protein n=3 Tax=Coccidioides immitis TaxID=5501 RepID=A0A0J8QW04_COCIT|nr:hypothetical protein CIRG_06406 [Coccidioides immitis RMSCC 2394]KMU77044.1 hypothetical protein CISG_06280 [Coccidioides immitis RMSCC 3703]KMU90464.1 hypothetical protein CIHG_08352 [Coccidioides immitis H538.4]
MCARPEYQHGLYDPRPRGMLNLVDSSDRLIDIIVADGHAERFCGRGSMVLVGEYCGHLHALTQASTHPTRKKSLLSANALPPEAERCTTDAGRFKSGETSLE